MKFAILGNLENRRVVDFCKIIRGDNQTELTLVSWKNYLTSPDYWLNVLGKNDWIRIESPGEDPDVQNLLSTLGSTEKKKAEPLKFGEIGQLDTTYRGFCIALGWLKELSASFFNHPADICQMFDKWECHQIFQKNLQTKVHEGSAFLAPLNFKEPIEQPDSENCYFRPRTITTKETVKEFFEQLDKQARPFSRFFLKPRFGSSASGVCAFHRWSNRIRLLAPIEIESDGNKTRLFNSLKVRSFTDFSQIEAILSVLLPQKMIVEDWIPKARVQRQVFDFRILVINGRARHSIARGSFHPVTNLHLGNNRISIDEVLNVVGNDTFNRVKKVAEGAARCFPKSHTVGVDVIVSSLKKEVFVCEINAFGDLLPGVIDQKESVYQAIWNSWLRQNQ